MNVGDHGANVTSAVGRLAVGGVFDAVEVVDDGRVVVGGVAFVDGVDLASGGDGDLYQVR